MQGGARRVQDALAAAGSAAQVVELADSTRSAAEAARAVGVEVGRIAKSLVFLVDGEPIVAVLSGEDRLDTEKLGAVVERAGVERAGVARAGVERADADTVRAATGYPIGGVSPVGHDLRVLVDASLSRFETVWVAAGTPHAVFEITSDELVAICRAEVADLREG